jgi:ABC-2 type transport system ATP-binding protein
VNSGEGVGELLLELRDVTMRYGRTVALERASVRLLAGDSVAVLGPDGAGKSTLLRTLAGLARPTDGTIESHLAGAGVGYAGSTFDLYGDLTVLENLSFFGRVRGMQQEKLAERIEAMLSLTNLRNARDRLAGRLSGGMKKGLALACALVHEPALLLLDEPTVGVDPVSRQELWDIIAQATAGGTALVFTSTYLEEANHAVRLIAMAGGRVTETSVDQVMAESAGWSAWVTPVGGGGTVARARLAEVAHEPRVYLRPEGLTVLAAGEDAARSLLDGVMGPALAGAPLVRSPLTFEDAFVLLEGGRVASTAEAGLA